MFCSHYVLHSGLPKNACSIDIGLCVSAACAAGETSPNTGDTDGDGLADDQEGTNLVCSADNLKPIDLYRDFIADTLLAIETFYSVYQQLLDPDWICG